MEWQARPYPMDVFPSLVTRIASLITAGRFLAPAISSRGGQDRWDRGINSVGRRQRKDLRPNSGGTKRGTLDTKSIYWPP